MMKKHATLMMWGLAALAAGCGEAPREEAPQAAASELQAAPAQGLPSVEQLAATRTDSAVTAVPVKYVVDPGAAPQLRASPGTEAARQAESSGLTSARGARREAR